MKLEERLKSMVNKKWLYNTRELKLLSFKIDEDEVQLVTDKEWLAVAITKINAKLEEFLPVEEEEQKPDMSITFFNGNGHQSLRDLVQENITNIKDSGNYIPTARALNEQIKLMIEMAKLEIMYKKINSK